MKNKPSPKTKAIMSLEVLDLIKDKQSERHSKLQALCSLLDKAVTRYIPNNVPMNTIPRLEECQFVTTISELADEWHWHRATVRGFLEKLEELGHLEKHSLIKCFVIEMTCIDNSGLLTSEVSRHFIFMMDYTTDMWLTGKFDRKIIASLCEHITTCSMNHYETSVPERTLEMERAAKNEILHAFIASLLQRIRKSPLVTLEGDKLEQAICSFFVSSLSEDWDSLLLFIEELPEVVLSGKPSSFKLVSDEEVALFQQVCENYRAFYKIDMDCYQGLQKHMKDPLE